MPAHKMHLSIANDVNKYLKLENDLIMIGSVLPDITESHTHRLSHCRTNENGINGLANPNVFLEKYREQMHNPIIIGYLIHLLTDEFCNRYIYEKYYLYDINNNTIGLRINNKNKYIDKESIKKMKHHDFKMYDRYLLCKGKVQKFKNKECYKQVNNMEIAKFNKEYLRKYIKRANREINLFNIIRPFNQNKFKLLNLKELNILYDKCCNYIIKFLNEGGILSDY